MRLWWREKKAHTENDKSNSSSIGQRLRWHTINFWNGEFHFVFFFLLPMHIKCHYHRWNMHDIYQLVARALRSRSQTNKMKFVKSSYALRGILCALSINILMSWMTDYGTAATRPFFLCYIKLNSNQLFGQHFGKHRKHNNLAHGDVFGIANFKRLQCHFGWK